MEGYLPNEVIYRDKAGFGLPIKSWVEQWIPEMREYLDRGYLKSQGIFDFNTVNHEVTKLKNGDTQSASLLYSYFIAQKQLSHLNLN